MADLEGLIRVRKYTTEQKQKFLSELYRHAEDLERQKKNMLEQLDEEKRLLAEMPADMQRFFGAYANGVHERIEEIEESRSKLETRIQAAQEDLRQAFSELKKIEIIQEQRKAEEAEVLLKKENDLLDDVALDIFRRNTEEN